MDGNRIRSEVSLIDLGTNTVIAGNHNAPSGFYQTPVTLGPGSYRLFSQMASDVFFNRGTQGTVDLVGLEAWQGTYDLILTTPSAAVPEPTTIVALTLGAAALIRRRRARR